MNAPGIHKDTPVVLFPLYCAFDSPSPFPSDFPQSPVSQVAPNRTHLLAFVLLYSSLPHYLRVRLFDQSNTASGMEYNSKAMSHPNLLATCVSTAEGGPAPVQPSGDGDFGSPLSAILRDSEPGLPCRSTETM